MMQAECKKSRYQHSIFLGPVEAYMQPTNLAAATLRVIETADKICSGASLPNIICFVPGVHNDIQQTRKYATAVHAAM